MKIFVKYFDRNVNLVFSIITVNGQQLLYRPSDNQCDWEDRVECDDRPICDHNDQNCRSPHHTTPKPSTPCDNVICDHGDDFYPEGKCSRCFCQCHHNGIQDEICCAEGLIFNPNTHVCDWPFNVNGC